MSLCSEGVKWCVHFIAAAVSFIVLCVYRRTGGILLLMSVRYCSTAFCAGCAPLSATVLRTAAASGMCWVGQRIAVATAASFSARTGRSRVRAGHGPPSWLSSTMRTSFLVHRRLLRACTPPSCPLEKRGAPGSTCTLPTTSNVAHRRQHRRASQQLRMYYPTRAKLHPRPARTHPRPPHPS